MPLSTRSVSLPVSERQFSAPSSSNLVRSVEGDFSRLSEIESRSFWLDTIPLWDKAASAERRVRHQNASKGINQFDAF
jgi:hypothetical protein